jgi:lysophospholipase L1-like esterase
MRNPLRNRLAIVAACAALVLVVPPPAPAGAAPGVYVALGDSYTAGPFIPKPAGAPAGCLRSDHAYPRVLAGALRMPLRGASCSGATISKLTRSQEVIGGTNPPQLKRLSGDVSLVTLQIGGNDVDFIEILLRCVTVLPFGSPCRDRYVRNGIDQISNRIAATGPRIATAIEAIHERAPRARVVVLGYPAILPDTGRGCWPLVPFAWDDVPYLRARHKQLNSMLAAQAAAHRARYVDLYGPSVGHDACAPRTTRWVEPIAPGNPAAPLHPNAGGMRAMAQVIARSS